MKFTCLQENFSRGLGIVSKAISVKTPLPVLSNVLIVSKDGRIQLTASNMETTITTFVGGSVDVEGGITVPAKLIGEFVSNLSPGSVSVELKDSILNVSTEKTKAKFNGISAESYPELPDINGDSFVIELNPRDFLHAVSSVAFSAATDDTRPILTGILLHYSDGYLTFATADGFRLSERVVEADTNLEEFNVVIPSKTLIEVARIFSSSNELITFTLNVNDSLAQFESEGIKISTRILNGNFPDYKKLIPSDYVHSAEFLTQDLLEAVKLTNVFAKSKAEHSPITIIFDPEGFVSLISVSQETGENHSQIEAEVMGEKLEVVFNSKFLLDILNSIGSEKIVFSSNGNLTPGVIRDPGADGYIHLIMPLRNQN